MGEFKVHRVRFFDYTPAGIRCMAFSPETERLALARQDGTVEIFNFSDNYFQEKVIPGNDSRSIEAVCWVGGRLFTAGLNGELTEYDLVNLRPKYSLDAFGGPVWTLACSPQRTHLAVGCEDGLVKLFEVLPEKIQFERNLDRQKGRVISLSWSPSGTQIAAGLLDTIRVFDVQTGRAVRRMLVDRGPAGRRGRECAVWGVAFLSDGTVVSGDSAGKVQFWDGRVGTLIRTHPVSKWDVLTLSVSQDERSLVAGTSEGTLVQFQFLSPALAGAEREWVRTRTFRHHTHDVRAAADIGRAVVSGGMDAQLVIRPLLDKVDANTPESALRRIQFPHRNLIGCAQKAGFLLFQFPSHLELWRLGEADAHGKPGETLPVRRKPEKLLHLKAKGDDHIACSAVSPCGAWLAFSTASGVRLFRLRRHDDDDGFSVSKVSRLPKVLSSAHRLCFSPDSSRLFAASARSAVHVISLGQSECEHLHTFKPPSGSAEPVHLLAASADGAWLATANRQSEVHIYNLRKLKPHSTVPVYSSCPSAIAIHPKTNNLLMVHADRQIFEFSIEEKRYTDWSRKLQKEGLHRLWLERDTPVTNAAFNPRNPEQFLLHDAFMFCVVDQSLPLPDRKTQFYNQLTLKSLSEQERLSHTHAFKVCKKFQPLLFAGLLEDGALAVVERPLQDIVSQLPAPVRQKKFAT
ncbi:U3 small nucleolar RNA-associated protein 4 homolog [Megalops cyprinoides]|uniref:U3 small nucleolar RNA-associated protein 4 homolog n=1 Tax=Megalops cyprinoides TaxID=118141 RepID=UPI0018650253|nr:U3 small nucleolar RNA-associated protein 4 homolog [Megalops cyprinoides]